jgi:hypothetical protein
VVKKIQVVFQLIRSQFFDFDHGTLRHSLHSPLFIFLSRSTIQSRNLPVSIQSPEAGASSVYPTSKKFTFLSRSWLIILYRSFETGEWFSSLRGTFVHRCACLMLIIITDIPV